MKLVTAVSLLALIATPAMANDYPPAPKATATGGNASAHQHQSQQQSLSNTNRNSSRATGGASSANASNNGSNVSVVAGSGGGSGDSGNWGQSLNIPSIGGGGGDCPVVGAGIGADGRGGGGLFSYATISKLCNERYTARLVSDLYGPSVARAYMEQNIAGIKEAVASASQGNHTDPKPVRDDAWCNSIDTGHQALTGMQISDYTAKCR